MQLRLGGPFSWSTPADIVRTVTLLLAVLVAFGMRKASDNQLRRVVRYAPVAAAALSAGYVAYYLRGGPRIIDATAYYLQARTFAAGQWAIPLTEPELSVLGRFLLRSDWHGPSASVIFPPGFPAILALGFLLGMPLAVGPAIAAAITLVTARLARLAMREFGTPALEWQAGATASVMSVGCAALRYHTADTMSHGWAALTMATALGGVWLALSKENATAALAAGLAFGWLFATRPTTAVGLGASLALALACGWLPRTTSRAAGRLVLSFTLGASLPAALWFTYQHAATGAYFATAQHRYYATSDGPPGCFRYGFGAGIGCLGEHGDFVRHNLSRGYGITAALATTGRRLLLHVTDVLNFGPLAVLVLLGARTPSPFVRLLSSAVLFQIAAYIPFYFDGSYPGGGARMFADALPLEHVLAAIAVTHGLRAKAQSHTASAAWLPRARATLTCMLLGFSFGAGQDHEALRDREGSRPMFEESQLESAGVDPSRALVFADTDHGFNLAYGPGRRVARWHDDDLDRLAWEAHGRPTSVRYRYRFEDGGADILPIAFDLEASETRTLRVEGESLWPPSSQNAGWAWPTWRVPGCASHGHALELLGEPGSDVTVRLPQAAAARELAPRILIDGPTSSGALSLLVDGQATHIWRDVKGKSSAGCVDLPAASIPKEARTIELRLTGKRWALDALHLSKRH